MKQAREKRNTEIEKSGFDTHKYKTKIMEKMLQEDVSINDSKQREIEEKKRKFDKMVNYAKVVKEMHFPQASEEKRKEIERIKDLLNQRNKRRSAPPNKRGQENEANDEKPLHKKPVWNFFNPMVPKPQEK